MFNQINTALVSIKDDFQKHLKNLSYSKFLTRSVLYVYIYFLNNLYNLIICISHNTWYNSNNFFAERQNRQLLPNKHLDSEVYFIKVHDFFFLLDINHYEHVREIVSNNSNNIFMLW